MRTPKLLTWSSQLSGCPTDFSVNWLGVTLPKNKALEEEALARSKNLQQSWMKLAEDIN